LYAFGNVFINLLLMKRGGPFWSTISSPKKKIKIKMAIGLMGAAILVMLSSVNEFEGSSRPRWSV